jgi:two-component system NarL family response regulator
MLREALVKLLRKHTSLTVVGENQEIPDLLENLVATPHDVLLLNSLETLRALGQGAEATEFFEKIKIVMFGMEEDTECFLQAVRLGISGYLLSDASSGEIIAAVHGVTQGKAICPPKLCKILFGYVSKEISLHSGKVEKCGQPAGDLTCRQRQLMALVAKGMTNKEIAENLQLSEFTVKNHIRRVMTHLQADNRYAAVDVIRTGGLFLSLPRGRARNHRSSLIDLGSGIRMNK